MGNNYTPSLIEILRKTLERLEEAEGLDRTDPAYVELTRRIARVIAELEIAKLDKEIAA
jgi:hypothetical protein